MSEEQQWRQRIEGKLDQLTEAMITLARVEERQAAQLEVVNKLADRVYRCEQKVEAVSNSSAQTSWTVGGAAKAAVIMFTAVVGAIAATIGRNFG